MRKLIKNVERIGDAKLYGEFILLSTYPKQLGLFIRDSKKRVLSDDLAIDRGSGLQNFSEAVVGTELKSASSQDSNLIAVSGSNSA